MHHILFRGKRLDNGEWAFGSLVVANDRINNGKHYILQGESDFSYGDGGERVRIGCFVEVDPATVGQYTGMADKDGELIFEGDVIAHHVQDDILVNRGAVIWDEKHKRWAYQLKTMRPSFYMYNAEAVEVIGNIYDNPDLLLDDARKSLN